MGDRVVSRFAPSPTGHLHIGGARTALFNWALAQRDGSFLLRIEDTDRARSSEEAVRGILEDLVWLGIDWDEGPEWTAAPGGRVVGGDPRGVGPFYQAERRALYDEHIGRLIDADRAYPAFESEAELDRLRRAAQAQKRGFRYRRPADWDRDAALARMGSEAHVIRFRMPEEPLRVADEVLGAVEFAPEHFDDFVIRKRDGFPTYHLAVVVDDETMGVTHVLRGQEHLNNTPRHVALQRALGFRAPTYAHMSLTFNPDGSKISKRDKDKAARAAVRAALQRDPAGERGRLTALVTPERLDAWLADKKRQLEPAELVALADALGVELPGIDVPASTWRTSAAPATSRRSSATSWRCSAGARGSRTSRAATWSASTGPSWRSTSARGASAGPTPASIATSCWPSTRTPSRRCRKRRSSRTGPRGASAMRRTCWSASTRRGAAASPR
jgi:glutamyl-tRNA synthetase